MSKQRLQSHPLEFKQSSAKLAATGEQSISQTAKDLGIPVNTLYGWIRRYYPKGISKPSSDQELLEEVKQLRKENARLKQERDILKKAAAYFASEAS